MDVLVLPLLARVRQEVLHVDGTVGMADEMYWTVSVLAIRVLDQMFGALQEPAHVGRKPSVIPRDADVEATCVAGCLERLIHRLVRPGADRPAGAGDRHPDAAPFRGAA